MKENIFDPLRVIIAMPTTVLNALKLMFQFIVIGTISGHMHI